FEEPALLGRGNWLLGGADFDRAPGDVQAEVTREVARLDPGIAAAENTFRGVPPACASFRTLRFDPLPRSRAEIEEIARSSSAPIIELTGSGAAEGAFKKLAPGRRVVHVATHAI